MNNYRFEFLRYNFNVDKFNKKQAFILTKLITNSRLNKEVKFNSYGIITFDENDKQNKYPNIELVGEIYNKKVNCLVFDLCESMNNNNVYNKLFIYQTTGPNIGNYGYLLYNDETQKYTHKFFIEYEYDSLMKSLNQSLNLLGKLDIYKFYEEKYDAIKNNKPPVINDITNFGYQKMINNKQNRILNFIKKYN